MAKGLMVADYLLVKVTADQGLERRGETFGPSKVVGQTCHRHLYPHLYFLLRWTTEAKKPALRVVLQDSFPIPSLSFDPAVGRVGQFVKIIRLAIDVSHPYATLIKRGDRIPHPRHWQQRAKLAGVCNR